MTGMLMWHRAVKKLVDELDFSFHIVSTNASSGNTSAEALVKTVTQRSANVRSKQE